MRCNAIYQQVGGLGKTVTSSISGSHLMSPLPFFSPLPPQSHLEKIIEKPNQPAARAIKSADSFEEKVSPPKDAYQTH